MKIIKKLITATVLLSLILLPQYQAKANTINGTDDESIHCITVIEEIPVSINPGISLYSTAQTKTGSKTVYYKNADNETLWYVKVTATFSYNGSTSTCKSASVTAGSNNSYWKVSNKKSSYSGNHGTASATGKKYLFGIVTSTINRSVTLTCSPNGTLS